MWVRIRDAHVLCIVLFISFVSRGDALLYWCSAEQDQRSLMPSLFVGPQAGPRCIDPYNIQETFVGQRRWGECHVRAEQYQCIVLNSSGLRVSAAFQSSLSIVISAHSHLWNVVTATSRLRLLLHWTKPELKCVMHLQTESVSADRLDKRDGRERSGHWPGNTLLAATTPEAEDGSDGSRSNLAMRPRFINLIGCGQSTRCE